VAAILASNQLKSGISAWRNHIHQRNAQIRQHRAGSESRSNEKRGINGVIMA
jgi:hypothetical protein